MWMSACVYLFILSKMDEIPCSRFQCNARDTCRNGLQLVYCSKFVCFVFFFFSEMSTAQRKESSTQLERLGPIYRCPHVHKIHLEWISMEETVEISIKPPVPVYTGMLTYDTLTFFLHFQRKGILIFSPKSTYIH